MVPICQPMQQSFFGRSKWGRPFIHKWFYYLCPSFLIFLPHVTTFKKLCMCHQFFLNFWPIPSLKLVTSYVNDLNFTWFKIRHLNGFQFLVKMNLKLSKLDLYPISLDCLAWLGHLRSAFMICPCANLVHLSSYIYNIRTYFDNFLQRKNISLSSQKQSHQIKCRPRKKNNLQNETMNPSFQKERNYFKILFHLSYECLCSNLVL